MDISNVQKLRRKALSALKKGRIDSHTKARKRNHYTVIPNHYTILLYTSTLTQNTVKTKAFLHMVDLSVFLHTHTHTHTHTCLLYTSDAADDC